MFDAPDAWAQGSGKSAQSGAAAGAAKKSARSATALTAKELEDLVKTLEDKDKRDAFVKTLKGLIEAKRATEADGKPQQAGGFVAALSRGRRRPPTG